MAGRWGKKEIPPKDKAEKEEAKALTTPASMDELVDAIADRLASRQNAVGDDDTEKAQLKLVKTMFETPSEHLPELTVISRRKALPYSMVATFPELTKKGYVPGTASQLWLNNILRFNRSIGGRHLMYAMGLAEAQMAAEDDDLGEKPTEL